ncbi:type II restriction endonuclease [Propionivibrio limicola]|uniref:type II restriction endonuclease n=1 Tax=Propionivibrio limicola TaxID=167645 RepID=UPI001291583C|nr:type II restriction endonuclease [Propionivibrio limicola]
MAIEQWSDLLEWFEKSSQVFIKKLSRNDCGWAEDPENGHQSGVYIPSEIRQSGFFPELRNLNREKPHIFESPLPTIWPSSGETKESKLKHYSNKGSEMHFTGVPKEEFAYLTPASLLVGGVLEKSISGCFQYWFLTVDSASEIAELLETSFNLDADFHFGLFSPSDVLRVQKDETEQLIDELLDAIKAGQLEQFVARVAAMPSSEMLARQAQQSYMTSNGLESLDPYRLKKPGDALMKISRDIEFSLYKSAEMRFRAAEVIRIITTGGSDIVSSIVHNFRELDALFLSASQQRKSRAGRSFEHHISKLLGDGGISFEAQAVTGGRRPDFVMPNVVTLQKTDRTYDEALILSAKTTLRERWKQVGLEKFRCTLFLATVDDRVSASAISDMESHGIHLVVPESLKSSKETCYAKRSNVISFRDFFDEEIANKRAVLVCC